MKRFALSLGLVARPPPRRLLGRLRRRPPPSRPADRTGRHGRRQGHRVPDAATSRSRPRGIRPRPRQPGLGAHNIGSRIRQRGLQGPDRDQQKVDNAIPPWPPARTPSSARSIPTCGARSPPSSPPNPPPPRPRPSRSGSSIPAGRSGTRCESIRSPESRRGRRYPCSRSSTSPSATGRSRPSTAHRSRPRPAGSSGSSGPTAPARPRRCAASSASPGPIAARSAGDGAPVDRDDPAPLRVHARTARALSADAGRRAGRLLRPAARPVGPRRDAADGRLARADGPGEPGQVQARGAVARQPAAHPAGDGPRPRPGAARPRRAVLAVWTRSASRR